MDQIASHGQKPLGTASARRMRSVFRTAAGRGVCDDAGMKRRVLIVDDHAGFRASARATLEADGFTVVGEAATGAEAVAAMDRLRPEIVILDVQLPDMSGFDVCAECLTGGSRIPAIVLVSSRDAEEYGPLIARSGACGFVGKADLSGAALLALLS
jgi:DNA-binding NarL/FixJ family response regulator